MKNTIVLLLFALGSLGACSSVDVTRTSEDFYDPTDPGEVAILRTEPKQPFRELGTLTVSGFRQSETASMHQAIRNEAAKLGGHAALIQEKELVPKGFGTHDQWCCGVVLRFEDPDRP